MVEYIKAGFLILNIVFLVGGLGWYAVKKADGVEVANGFILLVLYLVYGAVAVAGVVTVIDHVYQLLLNCQ